MTVSLHHEAAADINALVAVLPPAVATTAMAAPARASSPADTPAEPTPQRRAPASLRSAPVLSGLSVAMAMVVNLLRPDLSTLLTLVERPRFRLRRRAGGRG
jgi:hypothetical protein